MIHNFKVMKLATQYRMVPKFREGLILKTYLMKSLTLEQR